MNQLVPISAPTLPALVAAAGELASMRFLEFFAANIRNPHTRRAYARAAEEFLAWCASVGVPSIAAVQPVHVATVDRGGNARAGRAERQATAGRDPSSVRLARYRSGRAIKPGRVGARASPRRHLRANAGARSRRSARCSIASIRRRMPVCATVP